MTTSNIPDSLLEDVSRLLRNYSTALIRLTIENEVNCKAILIGSGTFVTIENTSGILTAHHVASELSFHDILGLTLIEQEHNMRIPCQHLKTVDVAVPEKECFGPDLSFIVIPDAYLVNIRAYKSFYPVMADQEKSLKDLQERKLDSWFIYGIIGERTSEEVPAKGFETVMGYHGFCGMTIVEKRYSIGMFDYIEVKADNINKREIPQSFRGMSGGGLWRIPLIKNEKGVILIKDYLLEGVVFFQTEMKDGTRFIRCHGPGSINKVVYKAVVERSS